jgi:hypothetical protein
LVTVDPAKTPKLAAVPSVGACAVAGLAAIRLRAIAAAEHP